MELRRNSPATSPLTRRWLNNCVVATPPHYARESRIPHVRPSYKFRHVSTTNTAITLIFEDSESSRRAGFAPSIGTNSPHHLTILVPPPRPSYSS